MATKNSLSDESHGLKGSDSSIRWSSNGSSTRLRSHNSVTIATETNPRIMREQGSDIAWLKNPSSFL